MIVVLTWYHSCDAMSTDNDQDINRGACAQTVPRIWLLELTPLPFKRATATGNEHRNESSLASHTVQQEPLNTTIIWIDRYDHEHAYRSGNHRLAASNALSGCVLKMRVACGACILAVLTRRSKTSVYLAFMRIPPPLRGNQ